MASSATSTIPRLPEHYSLQGLSAGLQPAGHSGGDAVVGSPATVYVATATTTAPTSSLPIGAIQSGRSLPTLTTSNDSTSYVSSSPTPFSSMGSGPPPVDGSDDPEVDEAILQALRSPKERLYMLMLGENMETLISERSAMRSLPRKQFHPTTTYHRLLIHRCSQYYKCTPEVDTASKTITVFAVVDSRIPPKKVSELVPADAAAALPSFKIMRRSTPEHRNKGRSPGVPSSASSASAADTSPSIASGSQCSDGGSPSVEGTFVTEPTETDDESDAVLRSLGLPPKQGRGGGNGGSNTPRKTIEEREAAYAEARTRIFMDFEEKEKAAVKLRADREREREVTEMHRDLADQESHLAETIPEILPNGVANGRLPYPRPATVGPIENEGPLRIVNDLEGSPADRRMMVPPPAGESPAGLSFNSALVDPKLSTDSAASLVSYPTLYDPDLNQEPRRPTIVHNPSPFPPPPPPANYDPIVHQYPTHPPPPGYGPGPYPYPVGMAGMPAMNGVPPMPMGAYPPYPPVPPNPQHQPHMSMGHGMMNMVPYPPYYPQMPPPANWGEGQMYPPNGAADGPPLPEGGYDMYGHPATQPPPPQQPYWPLPPPHSQQPPPHDIPSPHPPTMYSPNGVMNGVVYPPPPNPYYNTAPQQQPHPSIQNAPYAPPPPPQQYQLNHQYNAQQRGPPPQQTRQLWSPSGPSNDLKRGGHGRNSFSNNQQRSNRGTNPSHPNPTNRSVASQKVGLRTFGESPKDYGSGPASLIATPMSGPSSSYSGSRSRNSSISSTTAPPPLALRNNVWGYVNPANGGDGFAQVFGFGMRASGSAPGGPPVRVGMGDRRRSGSTAGSVAETMSVAGDESGTMTPLDETASMASSSMSSTSSSRTFTSTSSKHPSLPPRPEWAVGLIPGTHGSGSSHSSTRGKSASSSSSSNPGHSRTHSFQSQGRPSPHSILQSTDFPPLPGVSPLSVALSPQPPVANTSMKNTVWNGNARTALAPASTTSNQGRLDEPDAKYTRPPAKGSAALFDHKQAGKGSNVRSTTPVGGQAASVEPVWKENEASVQAAAGEYSLDWQMAQLTVAEHTSAESASAAAAAA